MQAIRDIEGTLRLVTVPDPEPGPGEALVRVRCTALNRADLHQRSGRYPPPAGASDILGLEAAGVVVSGGGPEFPEGSRVCALLSGGGYAELVAVPRELLMAVPDTWSWEQAAGFPEAFYTAYLNLFMEGGLRRGETVLIHAGASGVGTAAIQLAREAGCRVFATAGSRRKTELCLELGAEAAVDYRSDDFRDVLRDRLDGDGIDVILDMVGASYLERNLDLLAVGGRLVIIATPGGREGVVDLGLLMRKRALVRGSTLRSRPLDEKAAIGAALWGRFGDALREGRLVPLIDSIYSAADAEEAHGRMRENLNMGKIVLRFAEDPGWNPDDQHGGSH